MSGGSTTVIYRLVARDKGHTAPTPCACQRAAWNAVGQYLYWPYRASGHTLDATRWTPA